jgi:hypothetical protein
MNRELLQFVRGDRMPANREERRTAKEAMALTNTVRLAGLAVDGALALAGHAMEGVIGLDDHRKGLAHEDVARHLLLAELEETALQQVKSIQRQLFDKYGL